MRNPPSLLSLSIDSAVLNLARFPDLSPLPDHVLLDLFLVKLSQALSLSLGVSLSGLSLSCLVFVSRGGSSDFDPGPAFVWALEMMGR